MAQIRGLKFTKIKGGPALTWGAQKGFIVVKATAASPSGIALFEKMDFREDPVGSKNDFIWKWGWGLLEKP